MEETKSLGDVCRAVGLEYRCEHRHSEPRFKLTIDQQTDPPQLCILLRNDDSIVPRPIHVDPGLPAVLFALDEETVCREPTMNIWLPNTEQHRFVAWQEGETWNAREVAGAARVITAAEAVELVRGKGDARAG